MLNFNQVAVQLVFDELDRNLGLKSVASSRFVMQSMFHVVLHSNTGTKLEEGQKDLPSSMFSRIFKNV